MATKKVEDKSLKDEKKKVSNGSKSKKAVKKVTDNSKKTEKVKSSTSTKKKDNVDVKKNKTTDTKKKSTPKEDNINSKKAIVEEKVVCSECGKKYLASLDKCPNCGYSVLAKKNNYYSEEDEDENDYDDEDDYDDEEENEYHDEKVKKEDKIKKVEKKNKVKDKKKKNYVSKGDSFFEQNEDFINLIKILVAIVLLVGIVYFVVAFLNGEFKSDKKAEDEEDTVETIQNDKILASSIFDKADYEYYVLIYDGSSAWADYYNMIYENYASIEDENVLPLFWVDLSNKFNEDVVSDDETNPNAQKYSELSMTSPTLIHIKNGKNVDYYEEEEVTTTLSEMISSYDEE